jgi:hypothetical protein
MKSVTTPNRLLKLAMAGGAAVAAAAGVAVWAAPRAGGPATIGVAAETPPPGVTVSEVRTLDKFTPGEVQSTVVPPGKKWQCLYGRVLISNDHVKDPGEVALIDLDPDTSDPTGAVKYADVKAPLTMSLGTWRRIKSNDHDLVALPNGDVLLIKMGQSRIKLEAYNLPKPEWFDHTYKLEYENGTLTGTWGPGARSELIVWRSEDCGNTFEPVSFIDTARIDDAYGTTDDGSGGFPQDDNPAFLPGANGQPAWQMGGTDGPLVRVDPDTGKVYVTIGLAGNIPMTINGIYFASSQPLNRTVVMVSSDKGSSWQNAAVLPYDHWRLDVVPQTDGTLAFADSGWSHDMQKGYAFIQPNIPFGFTPLLNPFYWSFAAPEANGRYGWNTNPWDHPVLYKNKSNQQNGDWMSTNIPGQTTLTRSPGSGQLLLAYMDTIPGQGDGYRLYSYTDPIVWKPFDPIRPKTGNPDDFILHLTAVDAGIGPKLFYWYDVDTAQKTSTIRGRLIVRDDIETADFRIGGPNWVTAEKWYGDYHTAGAYRAKVGTGSDWTDDAYHYYPVWLEADGPLRVAHVRYKMPATKAMLDGLLPGHLVRTEQIAFREYVDLSRLVLSRADEEEDVRRIVR